MKTGMVYLVGAGPGDPGLLTLRAAELIGQADVVAYDKLIPPALLALARPEAELLQVGRRCGDGVVVEGIHPEVLDRARRGLMVVRLKAGDPMVFGRGGEEMEALRQAGIEYEMVPGITSALGAAACAAIPLTHRRYASDVTIATGHDVDGTQASHADWGHLSAGKGTLVMYMAARKVEANMARLMAGGRPPQTPAAYVAAASWPQQKVVYGTVATLARQVEQGLDETEKEWPALVVVGPVAQLGQQLSFRDRRPLAGCRIWVARARPGASLVARKLAGLGAAVTELPWVNHLPLEDTAALDQQVEGLFSAPAQNRPQAVVFHSRQGVEGFFGALRRLGRDVRQLAQPVAGFGGEACRALREAGLIPLVETQGVCHEAIDPLESSLGGQRLLLLTHSLGVPGIRQKLMGLNAEVHCVAAYRLLVRFPEPGGLPDSRPPHLVVLPSSSAAIHLLDNDLGRTLLGVAMAAIGPETVQAAQACGAKRVEQTVRDDREELVALASRMALEARDSQ